MVMMMLAGDNLSLVYQSSLAVLPAEKSGVSRRNGQRNEKFYVFSIFDMSMDLLYAVKSYDMGPSALLPIRRKV
jgi:hypothetical protein